MTPQMTGRIAVVEAFYDLSFLPLFVYLKPYKTREIHFYIIEEWLRRQAERRSALARVSNA